MCIFTQSYSDMSHYVFREDKQREVLNMSDLIEDIILTENCLTKAREAGISIRKIFEAITYGTPWVTDLGGLSFYYGSIEVLTCANFEYAITVIDHGQDTTHQIALEDFDFIVPQNKEHLVAVERMLS